MEWWDRPTELSVGTTVRIRIPDWFTVKQSVDRNDQQRSVTSLVVPIDLPPPVLPPDPDAIGTLHWLEELEPIHPDAVRKLIPAMWTEAGWHTVGSRYIMDGTTAAGGYRYHSQMVVPRLKEAVSPDIERMWTATKDLSK